MKIEKISDTQVKFVLSRADLEVRDIRVTELAYGNEKTQMLFREMMEQASVECGFEAEDAPLMIEAIPFSSEGIVIIATKVDDIEEFEERFNQLPHVAQKENMRHDFFGQCKKARRKAEREQQAPDVFTIFSFESLDRATEAAYRLYNHVIHKSVLFKIDKRYYLFLENGCAEGERHPGALSLADIDAILGEYGQKHAASSISQHYLAEHGEVIVKHPAIVTLVERYGVD